MRQSMKVMYLLVVHAGAIYGAFHLWNASRTMSPAINAEPQEIKVAGLLKLIAPFMQMSPGASFPVNPELRRLIIYPSKAGEPPLMAIYVDDASTPCTYCLVDVAPHLHGEILSKPLILERTANLQLASR